MILHLFLILWRLLWIPLLPLLLVYLWRRGRRDPDYTRHLAERFGIYSRPLPQGAIWFHAVSLGETRSATALIRLCLARGDQVVLTHFTPAGRRESARLFAPEIASGQLAAVWVPLDMFWCWRRFFRACRPRIGLTLEIEIWPAMIFAARRAGVPLFMCNAQYPSPSLARDSKGLRLRQRVIRGFAGAFVKSDLQKSRFESIGLDNITVTGELRFDQPLPPGLDEAASAIRAAIGQGREIITIASGVEVEEPLYTDVILRLRDAARSASRPAPFFIYVPRAPERFSAVCDGLTAAGLRVIRRSTALPPEPAGFTSFPGGDYSGTDILLGDSLGEMFFCLAPADRVVVGGGFNPRGAHNISEALMLMKPVVTGPWTWTIEFPFEEAAFAGVAVSLGDQADAPPALADRLTAALSQPDQTDPAQIRAFLDQQQGASARTLAAIDLVLAAGTSRQTG
ncbi:3-deoxy-D-manno-octulosonic acid transferase [Paracoccus sp. IB05]|uniref:3-deoxy-D-manno-octulosonic acid transferase n=1 Tax=Paracoccus sp. IB05 TaxID=2779367 RepID=UPI0018E7D1A6|nr:glycosyltransferase N-terminal domain-containing protein [Paracoccus sp. IB05]MBJ2151387.1 3-deoxy-D-manno-octulosonic acid transferase [Paracoccus sp. IB05]